MCPSPLAPPPPWDPPGPPPQMEQEFFSALIFFFCSICSRCSSPNGVPHETAIFSREHLSASLGETQRLHPPAIYQGTVSSAYGKKSKHSN